MMYWLYWIDDEWGGIACAGCYGWRKGTRKWKRTISQYERKCDVCNRFVVADHLPTIRLGHTPDGKPFIRAT